MAVFTTVGFLLGTQLMLAQYKSLAAGSTVNNLNKELVGSTVVSYPSMQEQIAIGAYLTSLDDLITLHQRERLLMKGNRSTEAGEGTHNQINVLILQLLNYMEISLLRRCHACMA